ncbi:putative Acyl carrier protein (ACP) [Helianthus anomalus]
MSKLQKSSFMYVTYCKLCPISSIITENVLDVCKPLQVMSFSPNPAKGSAPWTLLPGALFPWNPRRVTPDVHFQKDLGLDSLDNVEIVMAIEEEFKLEIPDKEADKIDSCALAIEYVYNHPMAS